MFQSEENRRLGVALACPAVLVAGAALASMQPPVPSQATASTTAAEEEVLDPEVEKILFPYQWAKKEEERKRVESILYPYRNKPEETESKKKEATELAATEPALPTSTPVETEESSNELGDSVADLATTSEEDEAAETNSKTIDVIAVLSQGADDEEAASTTSDLAVTDPEPASAPDLQAASTTPDLSSLISEEPASDPEPANDPLPNVDLIGTTSDEPATGKSEVALASAETPVTDESQVAAATPSTATVEKTPSSQKPFFGVGIRDQTGTKVTTLYKGSTALKMGVKLGDELVAFNDVKLSDLDSLRSVIGESGVGKEIVITIKRGGKLYKLGPLPMGAR